MEKLASYDFDDTVKEARDRFMEQLVDGNIWKFHYTEWPAVTSNSKPKSVLAVISNRIVKKNPLHYIKYALDGEYIIMQVKKGSR